jgi:glycosyltransferase involved in cell wall biosynthesis
MNEINLSLVMIIKDEEDLLPGCLESVKSLVDEIVIVDTGSTDRSIEIALSYGAKVFEHPWENHFAKSRNQSISYANAKYLLVLDADERIVHIDRNALHRYLQQDHPLNELCMVPLHHLDDELKRFATDRGGRIFRNHPSLFYEGLVHNRLVYRNQADPDQSLSLVFYDFIEIEHLGSAKKIYQKKNKEQRTLQMLIVAMQEAPNDPQYPFYYGRELVNLQRYEEGIPWLEKVYLLFFEQNSVLALSAILHLLKAYDHLDQYQNLDENQISQKIVELCLFALDYYPKHPDFWAYLGKHLIIQQQIDTGKQALEMAFEYIQSPIESHCEYVRHQPENILNLLIHLCEITFDHDLKSKIIRFLEKK